MSDDLSKQPNNSDVSDALSPTLTENIQAKTVSDKQNENAPCNDFDVHCIDSLLPSDLSDAEIMNRSNNAKDKTNDVLNSKSETSGLPIDDNSEKKHKKKNKKDSDDDEAKPKKRKKRNLWWLKISIISFVLAAFFSFISDLTSSFGNLVVILLLLVFLILGSILFDGIGVAVTSCDLAPLLSMSSRKVYGAKTAVRLVKNAEKVSNICNDVIGDIFGIISGGCSIVIVLEIMKILPTVSQQIITILLSSLVAALTIGGKAILKEVAIKNSKELVMFVAKFLAIFSKEERKIKKKK